MKICRLLGVGVAFLFVSSAAPSLQAQNTQEKGKQEQPKRSKQEQQDIDALIKVVDTAITTQAAPTDVPISWVSNHFVKSGDGATYIPFTINVDRTKLSSPKASMYVRVVTKEQLAAAASAKADDKNKPRVTYPLENIFFIDLNDNNISRGIVLPPGSYEMFVAVKDRATDQKNQPPAKVGLMRHELMVPDYNTPELTTSSIILANQIEPLQAPLSPDKQQENPYTIGILKIVPSTESKFSKTGELQFVFWVYGAAQDANRKPDVQIDYNFHQKTAEGEKYFNKTAPQLLNAMTLPPQFDMAAGHQLLGNLSVPLASFPAGDYRVEIKITDKQSGKSLTQNINFTVTA